MRLVRPLSLVLVAALALPVHAARLVIVHTNDTHGHALPYGDDDDLAGMARMGSVVKATRAAEPNTLFLSAGDTFEGTLFFNAGLGEFDFALLEAMGKNVPADAGIDGVAVGNHDFATGVNSLLSSYNASGADFPYFAANVNLTGISTVLDGIMVGNHTNGVQDATPYVVKTMPNGLRVGMFGMVTSDTAGLQPESTRDGVTFYNMTTTPDVVTIAQGIVTRLQNVENVDVIVMVNHLGLNDGNGNADLEDDTKIATAVSGIDVIVGGHDHAARPTTTTVNGTTLVYAGAYSRYVGTLDLDVTGGVVTVTDYQLQELNASVPLDPAVAAMVDGYKSQVEASYPGAYSDPVSRNHGFMSGAINAEGGLGNLVTDGYRAATGAPVAVELQGSLRFDTFRGILYPAEIFNILSLDFDSTLGTTVPLKRVQLFGTIPPGAFNPALDNQPLFKGILEILISDFLVSFVPSAGRASYSGLEFDYDTAAPDFTRITNLTVGGVPFDPAATYDVIISENVAQYEGFIDALLGIDGQPNEMVANTTTTTIEPWIALRDQIDRVGELACAHTQTQGRTRTVQPDLALGGECSTFVAPDLWTPQGLVTVYAEVLNFGLTASAATDLDVSYEETPGDATQDLVLATTIQVPSVPPFAAGAPGRVRVNGLIQVPASLPEGRYPTRLEIVPDPAEAITANNLLDVIPAPTGNVVAAHGAGPSSTSEVRIFDADGVQADSFQAYGTSGFGVEVGAADVDGKAPGRDEALTAPGPGPILGPHIRGFATDPVAPLAKISFYAYSTLRYGARVYGGEIDGDGIDEILTGAGNGAVFGPHVRAFNYDGIGLSTIAKVNFFAYSTLKYGVDPGAGDWDGDGYEEMVTTPGAGIIFGHHVRGFNFDGGSVSAMGKINFFGVGTQFGGTNAGSDIDGDGYGEIITAMGPGASNDATVCFYDVDGGPVASGCLVPFSTLYGAQVGGADRDGQPWDEVVAGMGPDPAAPDADVNLGRAVLGDLSGNFFGYTVAFRAFAGDAYGSTVQGGYFGY